MLKIGLTGGIGSGKTTTGTLFKALGVPIIDADDIARDLTQPNTEAFTRIIEQFGDKFLLEDGRLNRKLMRELIFLDTEKRAWLEQLLHPKIISVMTNKMNLLNSPYCIAVVPLLVESKLTQLFDRVLVIETTQALQLERTFNRDQCNHAIIKRIIDAQTPAKKRLTLADDIIRNNGNLENLASQVKKLDFYYKKMSE